MHHKLGQPGLNFGSKQQFNHGFLNEKLLGGFQKLKEKEFFPRPLKQRNRQAVHSIGYLNKNILTFKT